MKTVKDMRKNALDKNPVRGVLASLSLVDKLARLCKVLSLGEEGR